MRAGGARDQTLKDSFGSSSALFDGCCNVLTIKDGRCRPDTEPDKENVKEESNTKNRICVFPSRGVTVCERQNGALKQK